MTNDPKNKILKDLLKIILWNKSISHNLDTSSSFI